MTFKRRDFLHAVVLAVFTLGIAQAALAADPSAPQAGTPQEKPATASIDHFRVTGPYSHKNLAVYLLHSDQRDDREFLTLNEGLKSGDVQVTELDNEQVQRLQITNRSDKPLFLQEGDRVTGGKQDRTIYSSLIVAAKSGPQEIPSFCIEASRWNGGNAFAGNANRGYATNAVRQAAKLKMNQGEVWLEVDKTKEQLEEILDTTYTNTSLNEAIDSKQITEATKGFQDSLGKLFDTHKDAVGFAFAINGKILEVNVFPGNPLPTKIYPRMLETYAVDAVVAAKRDEQHATAKAPTKKQVVTFTKTPVKDKADRTEEINPDNQLVIFSEEGVDAETKLTTFRCETNYQGTLFHLQWIKAEKVSVKNAGQPQTEDPFSNDLQSNAAAQDRQGNQQLRQQ